MGRLELPIRTLEYSFVPESIRPVWLLPWILSGCLVYQATVSVGLLYPESKLTGAGHLVRWLHMYSVET